MSGAERVLGKLLLYRARRAVNYSCAEVRGRRVRGESIERFPSRRHGGCLFPTRPPFPPPHRHRLHSLCTGSERAVAPDGCVLLYDARRPSESSVRFFTGPNIHYSTAGLRDKGLAGRNLCRNAKSLYTTAISDENYF